MLIGSKGYDPRRPSFNIGSLILNRQYIGNNFYSQRRFQTAYIDSLEQEAVLKGHEGCVNCLEWSTDGRLLASGSDDFQFIIWDPFRRKSLLNFHTKHKGNMFSVKFLPQHNNSLIATGASDKYVYVYDINKNNECIYNCCCHVGRIKRLATAPDSPFIFWSAAEDGFILQLDIREPHQCRSNENRVRLINLNIDGNAEAKCLAINPIRTELLAVGANDPYARIYDRRMMQTVSFCHVSDRMDKDNNCVTYYCPGHISKNNKRKLEHESRAITYLTFNSDGTELLVNIGGEHIYLYDLYKSEQPVYLDLPDYKTPPICDPEMEIICANDEGADDPFAQTKSRRKVPEHVESYKKLGNEYLENEKYSRAIDMYTDAIDLASDCSTLYLNRATAYMRRQWFGDVYEALRDCHKALHLDPSYIKAQFRLARALLELERTEDANDCLTELINRFPNYSANHGVMMLAKDIKESQNKSEGTQQTPNDYESYLHQIPDEEFELRGKSKDFKKRFVGHCNTTTDIKEANYFGYNGEYIVAGSDDCNFYIWKRSNGKICAVYKGDDAIVNCVQPHPEICMMATSGIEHNVKLWSPMASKERPHLISYKDKCVEENQLKMKTDPFDLSTRHASCWNG